MLCCKSRRAQHGLTGFQHAKQGPETTMTCVLLYLPDEARSPGKVSPPSLLPTMNFAYSGFFDESNFSTVPTNIGMNNGQWYNSTLVDFSPVTLPTLTEEIEQPASVTVPVQGSEGAEPAAATATPTPQLNDVSHRWMCPHTGCTKGEHHNHSTGTAADCWRAEYTRKSGAAQHWRENHDLNFVKHACRKCGREFKRARNLKRHLDSSNCA